MQSDVIAVMEASAFRRQMAVVALAVLCGLLIYAAMQPGSSLLAQACFLFLGLFALAAGISLYQATQYRIELTADGLRDSSGITIARLDEIAALDRGFLAFKPSNGFVLRTKAPVERAWRLGLWWRFGRRIGLGGVVPRHQARIMADCVAKQLEMQR